MFYENNSVRIEIDNAQDWSVIEMNGKPVLNGNSDTILLDREKYESGIYLVKFAAQSIRVRL